MCVFETARPWALALPCMAAQRASIPLTQAPTRDKDVLPRRWCPDPLHGVQEQEPRQADAHPLFFIPAAQAPGYVAWKPTTRADQAAIKLAADWHRTCN